MISQLEDLALSARSTRVSLGRGSTPGHTELKATRFFGGLEKFDMSNIFMFVVKNRTRHELLPLMKKWIKPGSIIHSDCWKPYDTLGQECYTHLKVNNSI